MSSELAQRMGFTLEELALNRLGQMSDGQQWSMLFGALLGFALGALFVGAMVLILVLAWREDSYWHLKVMPVLCLPLIVAFMIMPTYDQWVACRSAKVEVIEGPIALIKIRAEPVIVIQGYRFGISDASLLVEGARYRVYYTAQDRLLSLEPVAEEEPQLECAEPEPESE